MNPDNTEPRKMTTRSMTRKKSHAAPKISSATSFDCTRTSVETAQPSTSHEHHENHPSNAPSYITTQGDMNNVHFPNVSLRRTDSRSPWKARIPNNQIDQITIHDLENPFNFYTLLMTHEKKFIIWLQYNGFLMSDPPCPKCNCVMKLNKRTKNVDNFVWRCNKCKNNPEMSLRKNSFFRNSHFYLQDIFNFMHSYIRSSSLKYAAKISGMAYKSSAIDWSNYVHRKFFAT
jgi:hypothetical protein